LKTLITGDIHGDFGYLNTLINKKQPDLIMCCGDFGYWPNMKWKNMKYLYDIKLQGSKILWCDGNHEDHWAIRDRTTDELEPGIIYMPRGSTYNLPDGRTVMFMGGAHSIDKRYRKLGYDWFPEETITQSDLYDLPEVKVDIFITHTCPEMLVNDMLKYDTRKWNDPSNYALSQLWNLYKPDLWFFGHWHHYSTGVAMGTKWYALSAAGFPSRWWMWLSD